MESHGIRTEDSYDPRLAGRFGVAAAELPLERRLQSRALRHAASRPASLKSEVAA
jgi:hypothetical protein